MATYIAEFKLNIKTDVETCNIKSLVVTKKGDILISDFGNGRLKLFSPEFKLLSSIKLLEKPWDLCLSGSDDAEAYVTSPFQNDVIRISLRGELAEVRSITTDGFCRGITWFNDGLAVVVSVDGKYQVHLMDVCGNLKTRIKTHFSSPFLLSTTRDNGRILVSDYDASTVSAINNNGDVLLEYHDKELSRPYSMATIDDDILVAGYGSANIHRIKTTGEKVKVILSWEEVGFVPQAIGLNSDQTILYVAGEGNKIRSYSIPNTAAAKP